MPAPPRAARWAPWVLAALCAAVYWPVAGHSVLSYDDDLYLRDPRLAGGLTFAAARWALTAFHASNWYPLTLLSHMLDASLFGGAAMGPHLENVFLHAACAIAVYFLLQTATQDDWRSAAAAAVFAVHPLQVETVAWLAERKNLLCALFSLLALRSHATRSRLSALLLSAAALACKPAAVTLPLAMLALDYWPLKRREPARVLLLEKLPVAALSAASCAVTLAAARGQSLYPYPPAARAANAALACAGYLRRLAWPSGLAVLYPHPGAAVSFGAAAAAALALSVALAFAWRERARRPWLLFGALWFLAWLLPTLGVVQAGKQALADRYAYLALLGPVVAALWSVPDSWSRKSAPAAAAGAAFVALLVCSSLQVRYWRDSLTLFRRAVDVTGNNPAARLNLGNELLLAGRVPEGEAQYREALAEDPSDAMAAADLGYALFLEGRADEAQAALAQARSLGGGAPLIEGAVARTRGLLPARVPRR